MTISMQLLAVGKEKSSLSHQSTNCSSRWMRMMAPVDRLCLPATLSLNRGISEALPAAIKHSREKRYKPTPGEVQTYVVLAPCCCRCNSKCWRPLPCSCSSPKNLHKWHYNTASPTTGGPIWSFVFTAQTFPTVKLQSCYMKYNCRHFSTH